MRLKLYPAEHETTNATEDVLDLLRQGKCGFQVDDRKETLKEIIVEGDLPEIRCRVREWLDQHPGRTATPVSFCDMSLMEHDWITTIEIHPPSLGFG